MIVLSIIAVLKVITINGANVLKTDITTQDTHGIVHVVDRVLFPPTVSEFLLCLLIFIWTLALFCVIQSFLF